MVTSDERGHRRLGEARRAGMSVRWDSQELLQPIAADLPCGESLEDTALLSSIDAARLFGRSRPLEAPPEPQDLWRPPDWEAFTDQALLALARSKDLRLLANLGAALLRTDGIPAFVQILPVASGWLETYWAETYPRLDDDGDATLRQSAVNCFADSMAVIEPLRRLPLVRSRQHGPISLRDIDIATGQLPAKPGEARPDEARVNAAFAAIPGEEVAALHGGVAAGEAAVRHIETVMGTRAGPEFLPMLEPLATVLARMERLLRAQVAVRSVDASVSGAGAEAPVVSSSGAVGVITSRQEALRALDAVADYFRHHEPSSPVPIFVERAKRLVSKSFLEVLADVVPEALPQARLIGGVPEGD